ncbi:hypothetical protein [Streptomyces sp.]|uniref:hypothetical protein n=1 Tax=Streptomyces sp. TaxID=1931 RepID=UPI002F41CBEE
MPQLTTGPRRADDEGPGAGGAAGASAVRAARRRPTRYLLFGAAFWLVIAVTAWRTPIASDFGQHASAVQRVKDDWWHPANPLLKEPGTGSPYYSPSIVALGIVAKATGASAWQVVRWCGPVNLAVLVAGVGAYARTLSTRRMAPVYALAMFTLLWGVRGKEWSGFGGAWSLTHGASYPSCFAVGVTFLLWTWTDRLARLGRRASEGGRRGRATPWGKRVAESKRRDATAAGGGWPGGKVAGRAAASGGEQPDAAAWEGGRRDGSVPGGERRKRSRRTWPDGLPAFAGLGVVAGVLLLIHPITSLAAGVGMAAVVAGRQRAWSWPVVGRWAVTACAALAVAVAWPYYDVLTLAGDTTVDWVHRHLYTHPWQWYGLALTGLPALALRARRRLRDPLVLMFAADCLIVGYGWVSGHYTYGRVFALLLVPLQFALAVELAAIPPWTRLRALLAPLTALALYVGVTAQIGAIVPQRYLPLAVDHPRPWPSYRWVADRVPSGTVVLTDGYFPTHVLPAYGIFLVAPTWPDPSTPLTERIRRTTDLRTCLDPRTPPATRTRILRRYDVAFLLLTATQPVPPNAHLTATSPTTGERLFRLTPR